MDRQGVAPGLRLRRGAVGRGFGCGSGRLGINVHRELETDLCRGPWFEFPGRRHHGAGRPFVTLTIRKIPLTRRQSRAGRKMQLGRVVFSPICALSAALASSPPKRRSSVYSSEVILDRGCCASGGAEDASALRLASPSAWAMSAALMELRLQAWPPCSADCGAAAAWAAHHLPKSSTAARSGAPSPTAARRPSGKAHALQTSDKVALHRASPW